MSRHRNHANRAYIAATALVVLVAVTVVVLLTKSSAPKLAPPVRLNTSCDNSASDAGRLQATINASTPSSQIVIEGPCLINKTIILLGGRSYSGDSRSTTLTEAPGSNLPALLASDSWVNNTTTTGLPIQLSNLTLDGNSAANKSGGDAIIIRSWQTTIQDITITNSNHNGLRITNLSENGTPLTNTQVNGTIRNLFINGSGQNGVYIQDSENSVTDWNLEDNWIASSAQNGVLSDNGAGWSISGNHLYGNGAAAIQVNRLFASDISDNYIEDFATAGITATVQGEVGSVLSGNRIFNFHGKGSTYLAITKVNYGAGQLVVSNNIIGGNGSGVGLFYQGGSNPLSVTSSGNRVSAVSTARSLGLGATITDGF